MIPVDCCFLFFFFCIVHSYAIYSGVWRHLHGLHTIPRQKINWNCWENKIGFIHGNPLKNDCEFERSRCANSYQHIKLIRVIRSRFKSRVVMFVEMRINTLISWGRDAYNVDYRNAFPIQLLQMLTHVPFVRSDDNFQTVSSSPPLQFPIFNSFHIIRI